MNTGLTHFKKGNKAAKNKAGKKHLKTLFKDTLKESLPQLDTKLFEISEELLSSRSQRVRAFAWKELLKYRLPLMHALKEPEHPQRIEIIMKDYADMDAEM